MASMQFDPEDIGMLIAGILASGVMTGLVTVSAFGYSFSDQLFSIGSGISLAYLLSAATLLGIIVTNDNEDLLSANAVSNLKNSAMADYYMWAILATVGLLAGWAFFPAIPEFVQSSDVWGVAYIAVTAAGQIAVGWMY